MSSNPAPPHKLVSPEDATSTNRRNAFRPVPQSARPIPTVIGRYRIVRLLGEGGMGTVYAAEQDHPRRMVAIKVLRSGLVGPDVRWRFEHETQALGRLRHPGIAQIYEAGTAEDGSGSQPYFAMELVCGEPLLQYADEHHLNTRQRLEIVVKICDAVQHAHQRGIIHRDLKPTNILVEESGQPKILDLGVARITDSDTQATQQTDLGQLVGTLAYMSPEQVLADPLALDTRSDVYALGVILFELLAGRLPYKISRQLPQAVQTIREEDPASLSAVSRSYRGDIETIVGKALEKDKARRYASAADLAADIERYLRDEPITARPPSTTYQLRKFARRNKVLVAGVAAVFLVLVGGIIASTWEATRARRAEASARAVDDFLQNDLLAQATAHAQARPGTNPDPDLKVRTALDRAAARVADKFKGQPLEEASIRRTIGNAYLGLGLLTDAQQQFERAVDLRRRILGERNPETLAAMNGLAELYLNQGRYAHAEPLLTKIIDLRGRTLGEKHPDTLTAMNDLAELNRYQGKYAPAELLFSKVLEARRRGIGSEHPDTLSTMNDLAELYTDEGKYAQAETLSTKVLYISRRVLGEQHPATLYTMDDLAGVYGDQGKYAQAEALYVELVEMDRRVMGDETLSTLRAMNNLAVIYGKQGKYAKAAPLFTKVLQIRERIFGPDLPATLLSMNNLAALYLHEGKYADAEPLFSKVLETRRRVLGEDHPSTLVSLSYLAELYLYQGKYARAEPMFTQVLQVRRRVLGSEHPDALRTISDLALLYQTERRYSQAEPLFTNVIEVRRRTLGSENPETLSALTCLGEFRISQRRYTDAEALLRSAVAGFANSKASDAWARYDSQTSLGASLLGQKKYGEAEPLLISGYEGMLERQSTIPVFDRYKLEEAGKRIVQLYAGWGKRNKAAEWRAKLAMNAPATRRNIR